MLDYIRNALLFGLTIAVGYELLTRIPPPPEKTRVERMADIEAYCEEVRTGILRTSIVQPMCD
ncbi:hypothetical protein GN330_16430 [Nitratireductor sp. CAU 1489]|uniref:Uncharacterized protein n=1 Tax=Nitratireductor arenosus TaxID=2682096 RepID=A0A844QHR1_9HYPH|nr:hypothetical protein [Nitratireductor arenosus]MVA98835.1 hypothetical protein [Nitratireductor arenosus]